MKQPDIAHGGSSVPESVAGVQPDVGGLQSGALSLLPQDHPNCDMALNNLADALMARYQQTGDTQMISEMIRLRRQVLALRPPGYPDRDRSIMMLNIVLMIHLQHAGETETLSEIICLHREALALRPQGHRLRAGSLFSLAGALVLHYKQAGEVYILEEAICLSREALELLPQGHSVRGKLLRHLASVLSLHYEHSGDMEELAETIFLHKEVLLLCPKGHPDRRHALSDLGYELMIHYEQAGDVNTLEEAICLYRESLSLSPLGDPDRGSRLYNLSRALVIHFELTGDMDALAQSIYLQRDALVWYPHDHTQHGIMLNHLASALMRRYQRTGDMDVLGEAICLHRKALALHPKGHPSRILSLNNLALALRVSFEYDCDRDTLTEMVLLLREALALSPTNHPDRGQWLSNLAGVLWMCGEVTWDIDVLADSISLCRETLALYPKGHSIRSLLLSSLATVLSSRYKISGDTDALAESIHLNEEALTLCPQGHPDRGMILKSLAATYRNQFERDNDFDALSVAHKLQKEELDSWPEGHPNRHESHHLIARVQLLESSTFNWMEAFEHLKEAATDNSTSPSNRLSSAIVSLKWVEAMPAHISLQHSFSQRALDIYVLIIQLLPCAARVGLDLSTRLRKLSGSEQLCRAASTRAMLLQQLPMAIEVFEEGKAVFWSQLLRLRSTALDALPSSERKMLSNLFRSLEKDSGILMGDLQDNARIESQIEHRRQLNQQADSLIEDIRMRPGFEHFLKVPQYDKLAQAATNGFVVVLIANEPLFFAIVIHADDVLEHVPLPSVKGDMLRKLQAQVSESGMRDYTHASEGRGHNTMSRGISKEKTPTHTPLALMWKTIIQPIISHIGLKSARGRQRPRIHWCPSGDFALLPLHAAGIYKDNHQVCTADFIVSSYTPSLAALIKSRKGFTPVPLEELRVLVFGESSAPNQLPIPNVEEEVQMVAGLLLSTSATVKNNVDAVPNTQLVIDQLPVAHILHLACHGQQDSDPLQSCFALRDGPLTISALMKIDLPNAMVAFLSACETAKGDKDQPDQAVHLAASMLFCGFRSVVATMWSMYDADGPRMAQWFYEALLKKEEIDLDDIPYALDTAIQKLRAEGAPAARWATYMHMGA